MKFWAAKKTKVIVGLFLCLGLGMLFARLGLYLWPSVKQVFLDKPFVYFTSNEILEEAYTQSAVMPLDWAMLLPPEEQAIITHYQTQNAQTVKELSAQILRSIEASTDPNYHEALISTNTVKSFENKMVSLSGFVVPVEYYADKNIKSLFFVPYFGACLHYPPPPPNQMLFAQIDQGFSQFDITQAYTITGKISVGLFEDPMGTSAYLLEVVSIQPYFGQPDDIRRH
ncbi:MAG: DUF3299 domain-containing protein [Paraglaciecola sp.]|uniref:DUF3299 domain-containing protein n=1 Tax=Paraglaciecola sp. TaxID=1920173 RepID=UPI00329A46CB